MNFRIGAALVAALALGLMACPRPPPKDDGGTSDFDAGNPPPIDACSGGCAVNQVCDTQRRTCVDACGGCDAGTCTKVGPNQYQCIIPAVTCQGQVCDPGQVACLGGGCACLAAANSAQDTCGPQGKWCVDRACANPKELEQCLPGGAPCPTGQICSPVFGADTFVCVIDCNFGGCPRGELCGNLDPDIACLPSGLFNGQECIQNVPDGDGGWVMEDGGVKHITVAVSNTCLLKDGNGNITDTLGKGHGNCTYAMFKFYDNGNYPFSTCRPPGQALEGQPCSLNWASSATATQCSTGLECMITDGDQGVCMRTCNANPARPGFTPQPACGTGEACVNMYRYTDPNDNAVVGVCAKTCDVFDSAKNTCANIGARPASCVPSTADGQLVLSLDGKGICLPQQSNVAGAGQPCDQLDPFRGAACGSAQLCAAPTLADPAQCLEVCDTTCTPPADGGSAPTRCATQPAATCASGKTCHRVTSTTGARVGFCE